MINILVVILTRGNGTRIEDLKDTSRGFNWPQEASRGLLILLLLEVMTIENTTIIEAATRGYKKLKNSKIGYKRLKEAYLIYWYRGYDHRECYKYWSYYKRLQEAKWSLKRLKRFKEAQEVFKRPKRLLEAKKSLPNLLVLEVMTTENATSIEAVTRGFILKQIYMIFFILSQMFFTRGKK